MSFDMKTAKKLVEEHFARANRNLLAKHFALDEKMAEPISNSLYGYRAKEMEFGDYIQDRFTTLFIDIRNSTKRALQIGPEHTFLSFHAFLPGVAYTIDQYGGYVIDFMGDGVMAFFGGNNSGMDKRKAAQQAGLCGLKLQQVIDEAINPVLESGGIKWLLQCGVGVAHGPVVVTKVGTQEHFDVKAFGDSINLASKLSKGVNSVLVDDEVKKSWPVGKNGKVRFNRYRVGDGIYGYELRREA